MSAIPPFGAQLIGQTEKTLNAILFRLLDGTGLTEPQWIALVLACRDGQATAEERALHDSVQSRIAPVIDRLWGDLPAEKLAVAGHVLGVILQRAGDELAQAAR
jgi:hypothetical protein